MINTFSLEQISKTGSLDSNLITLQYKPNLMAWLMEKKTINTKLKQDQIAKELGCSSSTSQQNRQDINMFSAYFIPTNSSTRKHKTSNHEHDLERPQMTSKDLK